MKMTTVAILAITHALALGAGFAAGLYTLPILTAPPGPGVDDLRRIADDALLTATFDRDRVDSDALHWGEGRLTISDRGVAFEGRLAPGPDYRLYLSPEYVETEADVERLKDDLVYVGRVDTFENFLLPLDAGIDAASFGGVVVWCESFGEFITSGRLVAATP